MDIGLLMHSTASLGPDLLAEVEEGVHDRRGDARKGEAVGEREGRREEEGRIRLVLGQVERRVRREDLGDVVGQAHVVEGRARGDREVLGVPRVRVVQDRGDDPEEEREAGRDVRGRPPRRRERRDDVRDLGPVEGDERPSETVVDTKNLVDDNVLE